jgi:hypothetical protein
MNLVMTVGADNKCVEIGVYPFLLTGNDPVAVKTGIVVQSAEKTLPFKVLLGLFVDEHLFSHTHN